MAFADIVSKEHRRAHSLNNQRSEDSMLISMTRIAYWRLTMQIWPTLIRFRSIGTVVIQKQELAPSLAQSPWQGTLGTINTQVWARPSNLQVVRISLAQIVQIRSDRKLQLRTLDVEKLFKRLQSRTIRLLFCRMLHGAHSARYHRHSVRLLR